ncbi:hypothetical protein BH10PSE6_BH10PSE6_19590 [soil metagenome]
MADAPTYTGTASAADVVPALREQAGKVADKSLSTGVDAAQAVGKAAESAAQVLDEALPMLAGYVRQASQYTNQFADSLRDKKAEELLSTAVSWSRQQPLLTLAGAAVLGFALARVAKAGLPSAIEGAKAESAKVDLPASFERAKAETAKLGAAAVQPMSALGGTYER